MTYRITGLDPARFAHLFGRSDVDLAAHGARRVRVNASPGFPDRIALRDMAPGAWAILLNHEHQPAATPYRSAHAIFVRDGETERYDAVDRVPEVIRIRPISLRAFDAAGNMTDADLAPGDALEPLIARMLADPSTAYLHAHYAKRGCFAATITRD